MAHQAARVEIASEEGSKVVLHRRERCPCSEGLNSKCEHEAKHAAGSAGEDIPPSAMN